MGASFFEINYGFKVTFCNRYPTDELISVAIGTLIHYTLKLHGLLVNTHESAEKHSLH